MKEVILIVMLVTPFFAQASCITEAKSAFQQSAAQWKAHEINESEYDFAQFTYVNAQYACHLVKPAIFCQQIDTLATKTIAQIKKDYPPSEGRSKLTCQIAEIQGNTRAGCLNNPGLGALNVLGCE